MTGKTNTGNRIQQLKKEAAKHQRAIDAAQRLARAGVPTAGIIHEQMQERDRVLAEAARLKDSGQARLEDIMVYRVERIKETKKGTKSHEYYYASWRRGDRVFNQYLGSTKKLDYDSAMAKARQLKASDLGIHLEEDTRTS